MNKVPNLRFNNFNDEWQEHVLGDIFEFYTTNSFSRDFLDNDNGSVKNIHYGDIHMKFPTLLDVKNTQIPYVKETVDLSKISIESYCKNGDVVIADASEDYNDIGKAIELQSIGEEKVIAGLHTILARDNKGIMVNGFRGYLMTSLNVRKQIKVYAAGAKVLGISKANISKVNLLIPSSMEQEKIASFFSLIDKKIELQTEKVEELTNYKKGIMQKIFSQELRFKDENGNQYPEWEEKKLENIVEFFKGNGLSKSDLSDNGDIPCVLYGELFTQYDEVINVVKSRCLKDQGFKSEKYDVLMPTSDVTPEGLATASCILVDDVCLGGDINVLRPKKYINGIFLSYQINHFKSLIIRKVSGTTIKHIYVKDIKDIKYNIPCEKEQIKITDLLIQIDNKIKFESLKLESYNKLKKGLLQQMFI